MNFLLGVEYTLNFFYTGLKENFNFQDFLRNNKNQIKIEAQTYIDFVFGLEDFDEGFVVIRKKSIHSGFRFKC